MTDRNAGCLAALAGCAIAFITVGLGVWGCFGAMMQDVNPEGAWACVGLALLGGTIGLIVFVNGMAKAIFGGEEQNSLPDGMKLCQHCGSHLMGNPKTCKYCGADLS